MNQNIIIIGVPPPNPNMMMNQRLNFMMNQNNMMMSPSPMNSMMSQNNMMMMNPSPMNSMMNQNNMMMMNPSPMNSMMNQNNMMMMNPSPMNSMSMGMANSAPHEIYDDDEEICYLDSSMGKNNNNSSFIPMAKIPSPMNSISMGMENSSPPKIYDDDVEEDVCYLDSSMGKNNNNNSFIPSLSYHGNEMKHLQETININKKEDIMKIINTQDFINGFWEVNKYTNIIKEKYKKEYTLLKGIKSKNITDRVAITFLIIYFIDKEHPELLDELLMIIKKAKIFIFKEAKDTYENIIKEISISYIGLNY